MDLNGMVDQMLVEIHRSIVLQIKYVILWSTKPGVTNAKTVLVLHIPHVNLPLMKIQDPLTIALTDALYQTSIFVQIVTKERKVLHLQIVFMLLGIHKVVSFM